MRRSILALVLLLTSLGCASNLAHLDWRPGLSAIDFSGLYELSFDEYREFREQGATTLLLDRWHGVNEPEAAAALQAVREHVTTSADVEWFAATADRKYAALLAGPTLTVMIDRASIAIDAGSLLGPGLGGWQFTMVVVGEELTVFALPELGGVVAPDEPGYVFEFDVAPRASKPWQISVGRVSVSP